MHGSESSRNVARKVRAFIGQAAESISARDIAGVLEGLTCAVILYERHPWHAMGHGSHVRELLVLIRLGRNLCALVPQPDDDFTALEARADALRAPLH
jgi:hypothetical protein